MMFGAFWSGTMYSVLFQCCPLECQSSKGSGLRAVSVGGPALVGHSQPLGQLHSPTPILEPRSPPPPPPPPVPPAAASRTPSSAGGPSSSATRPSSRGGTASSSSCSAWQTYATPRRGGTFFPGAHMGKHVLVCKIRVLRSGLRLKPHALRAGDWQHPGEAGAP